jgi:hypothetical protein
MREKFKEWFISLLIEVGEREDEEFARLVSGYTSAPVPDSPRKDADNPQLYCCEESYKVRTLCKRCPGSSS